MNLVAPSGLVAIVAVVGFALAAPTPEAAAASGDEEITIAAPATEAAEVLDLHAVAGRFKDSKNLEEFEKRLNDPEEGINNLDLDDNGEVDFIRLLVEAVVGTDGRVMSARVVDSNVTEAMNRAALEAARACRFRPARQRHVVVPATVVLPFQFRLN